MWNAACWSTPALLTSTSSRPHVSSACAHHALAGALGADVVVIRDGFAARGDDLRDDVIGTAAARRVDLATPVVDQRRAGRLPRSCSA